MASQTLKNIAVRAAMHEESDFIYGRVEGYTVAIFDEISRKRMEVHACIDSVDARNELYVEMEHPAFKQQYGILQIEMSDKSITIYFSEQMTEYDRYAGYLFPRLRALYARGERECNLCGQRIDDAQGEYVWIGGHILFAHPGCVTARERQELEGDTKSPKKGRFHLGVIGAFFGAIVGAIPLALLYPFFLGAGLLAALTAAAARGGYRIMGGKPGTGKRVAALIFTLLGICVAIFLGQTFEVILAIASGDLYSGYADAPLIALIFILSGEFLSFENIIIIVLALGAGISAALTKEPGEKTVEKTVMRRLFPPAYTAQAPYEAASQNLQFPNDI